MTARQEALFNLSLDHTQGVLVLEALGELPWRRVHGLVDRFHAWGNHAFDGASAVPARPFSIGVSELELILQALGELPHRRVFRLIASLQDQLAQLRQAAVPGRAANG